MNDYKISKHGIKLLKKEEGVRYKMYKCPAGYPTTGVGHLILANEKYLLTKKLTEAEVDELLKRDIARFEKNLNAVVKVPLNQNQVDALLSLMFNIGTGAFNSSKVLLRLNQGKYIMAANNFLLWSRANGNPHMLRPRRETERELFLKS